MSPFYTQLLLHSNVKLRPQHWLLCCALLSLVMAHNILIEEIIFIRLVRSEGQVPCWCLASKCASLSSVLLVKLGKLFAHYPSLCDRLHLRFFVYMWCLFDTHIHIVFWFIDFSFYHYVVKYHTKKTRSNRTTGSDSYMAATNNNNHYLKMCRLFSQTVKLRMKCRHISLKPKGTSWHVLFCPNTEQYSVYYHYLLFSMYRHNQNNCHVSVSSQNIRD